jgi:BirA family transcriptional regulator, biotin operon repressor / biotin---[acetyl-CoA-carboxylase] ligase
VTQSSGLPHAVVAETIVEIDSTNDEVRRRAEAGALGPLWIRAQSQTKGRGRRGRSWLTSPGNLFMSGLLTLEQSPNEAANLSFVTALAVADAIETFVASEHVALKWPNDILLAGKKSCGILLESWRAPAGLQMAIGIGVNVATQPQNLDQATTCLINHCNHNTDNCTADKLFHMIIDRFHVWFDQWRGSGFESIRLAWLQRAYGLGQGIKVNLNNEILTGTFAGLSETGALLLVKPDGTRVDIHAGDVFF